MIATRLPGRTDNEIKNFWNTHLRKKLLQDGIDPNTHQLITDFSNFLPNFNNFQLANISLLENILRLLSSNPLPPFLVGSEILNRFHATSHGMPNSSNMENGDYQLASNNSWPPEIHQHGGNTDSFLPGLIPITPEISSGSKGQSSSVYDCSPPVQNSEQVFTSKNYVSWEAEADDEAFWKNIFCESFPSSSL